MKVFLCALLLSITGSKAEGVNKIKFPREVSHYDSFNKSQKVSSSELPQSMTVNYFNVTKRIIPQTELANCLEFYEKIENEIWWPLENTNIMWSASSNCFQDKNGVHTYHEIMLSPHDLESYIDLAEFIERTTKIDFWGENILYKKAVKMVHNITVNLFLQSSNIRVTPAIRSHISREFLVKSYNDFASYSKTIKRIKKIFRRGSNEEAFNLLSEISTQNYESDLSNSNLIEIAITTLIIDENGDLTPLTHRNFTKDCGIEINQLCI